MTKTNQAWYVSSTGSGVSMTLKGVLVGLVPLIAGLARTYGYDLPDEELFDFIEAGFQAVSLTLVVFGLGRKLFYKFRR